MKTLAELEAEKARAVGALETAEACVIGTARAVIDERRSGALGGGSLNAMLDSLAAVVDEERVAEKAAIAAREAIVAHYDRANGRAA